MVPQPVGVPSLIFKPFSFGQMKPIPAIPFVITLTPVLQSYLDIFIPKNTWGELKYLTVNARIRMDMFLPNFLGGPTYREAYKIDGVGTWNRGTGAPIGTVPQSCEFQINRVFILPPGLVIKEINWDSNQMYSLNAPDNTDHQLQMTPTAGAFDPTIDNYLRFQIRTNYLGGTDTVVCRSAQAFIQSALDLRRLSV